MKNIKKITLTIIAILTIVMLAGCSNQSYSVVVSETGAVTFEIKLITDRDTYNLLESYGIDTTSGQLQQVINGNPIEQTDVLFQEYAAVYSYHGFTISPVSDSVEIGFTATKEYEDYASFNADLAKLYDEKLSGLSGELTEQKTATKSGFTFMGTVEYITDPDINTESMKMISEENLYKTSHMTADVSIFLPGEIEKTDGEAGTNRVLWSTPYSANEKLPVRIISQTSDSNMMFFLIVGGVVVLLAVIIIVSRYIAQKKHSSDEDSEE